MCISQAFLTAQHDDGLDGHLETTRCHVMCQNVPLRQGALDMTASLYTSGEGKTLRDPAFSTLFCELYRYSCAHTCTVCRSDLLSSRPFHALAQQRVPALYPLRDFCLQGRSAYPFAPYLDVR